MIYLYSNYFLHALHCLYFLFQTVNGVLDPPDDLLIVDCICLVLELVQGLCQLPADLIKFLTLICDMITNIVYLIRDLLPSIQSLI